MLERLVELHWQISAILSDQMVAKRIDQYVDLKNEQWDLAKELLWSLKYIETATIYMSEEEKAPVSSILPILCEIIDNLNIIDKDLVNAKVFKTVVIKYIKKGWNLDNLCPILTLSVVLVARFTQLKFLKDT